MRALSDETSGLSLGQIARKVNLPRSTVQRIVGALASEGFITTETGGGGIRLGPEIQSLAKASMRDTKDELRPVMRQIADDTGETVDLAILDAGKMLFVDQIVGGQRLRTVSSIGESFPLTTTANGKAALACLDEADAVRLVLAEIEARGDRQRSLPALLSEIEDIRNGGLATDEDEHTEGVSALGFALKDASGDVFAISIPVPSSRYGRLKDNLSQALSRIRSELEATLPTGATDHG